MRFFLPDHDDVQVARDVAGGDVSLGPALILVRGQAVVGYEIPGSGRGSGDRRIPRHAGPCVFDCSLSARRGLIRIGVKVNRHPLRDSSDPGAGTETPAGWRIAAMREDDRTRSWRRVVQLNELDIAVNMNKFFFAMGISNFRAFGSNRKSAFVRVRTQ